MNRNSCLRPAAAFVLAWAALLSACGPSVGGSGTGDSASVLSSFGATVRGTCESALTTVLSCQTSGTAMPQPELQGTAPVAFRSEDGGTVLTIEGNEAVLRAGCEGGRFEGVYGMLPSGGERFFGHWRRTAAGAPVQALLHVQPLPGYPDQVQAEVFDAQALRQLGPLTLRLARDAGAPVCR